MSASGQDIFDDDVACDAHAAMLDLFRAGLSVKAATDTILEDFSEYFEDEEDAPVTILALASIQWDLGRLDERIKTRALKIITAGVDYRWEHTEYREERRAVLAQLGVKLNTPPHHPRQWMNFRTFNQAVPTTLISH